MSVGVAVWLALGAVFAILFFGTAAVVTMRGFRDLRELLGGSGKENRAG